MKAVTPGAAAHRVLEHQKLVKQCYPPDCCCCRCFCAHRVLERHPQNGKPLQIWGRFQEWALHDSADTNLLLLLLLLRAQGAGALPTKWQAAEDLGALPGVGAARPSTRSQELRRGSEARRL
jgi:hypothetical protein